VVADRFVIEELVGTGGMAHVFRAHDRHTAANVALKVTRADGGEGDVRFAGESELLVQLTHPAIVRHIAHGRADAATPYIAMEWLEGEDLALRLWRSPLSIAETLQLGARTARALAAAHAAGVVHRDIKPSNIVLRHDDVTQATVIDFGVAHHDWREASLVTRTGALLGTLGYMAPEQALRAKSADTRADVFSLGCVLFECLAGRRLFDGAHAVEILAKLLTAPIPRPSELVPGIPAALDALVLSMLDRDPALRPASCSAIADELERILVAPPSAPRLPRRRDGRRAAALIAASAVVLAGAAITFGARSFPPRPVLAPIASSRAPETSAPVDPRPTPPPVSPPTPAATPATPVTPVTPATPSIAQKPGAKVPAPSDPFGDFRN
jgi:serine/threonine protein kinase